MGQAPKETQMWYVGHTTAQRRKEGGEEEKSAQPHVKLSHANVRKIGPKAEAGYLGQSHGALFFLSLRIS